MLDYLSKKEKNKNHTIANQNEALPLVEKHSFHPAAIALTHSCSSRPDHYRTVASPITPVQGAAHVPPALLLQGPGAAVG